MFRIKMILIVIGGMLAFSGFQEFRVSQGTSAEPSDVELAALESGAPPESKHVLIGSHVAVYGGCVYEYRQKKHETGEPGPGTSVTHAYYPIISEQHSFFDELNTLSEKYGDESSIPDAEYPAIDNFKVLVKTRGFKTIRQIPDGLSFEESLQGLIVNSIDGLDKEEKQLVQSSFPNTDVDNVLMIELGRKPSSLGKSLGMIAGGVVLALLGVGSFFLGRGN